MRRLALLLVTLATVLLAGCQAGSEPGLQPADPPSSPTRSPSPTEPGEPAEDAAAPTGDPLTFGSTGGTVTIRCFPRGERRMVVFDSVTSDRTVSLTGLVAGGDALQV